MSSISIYQKQNSLYLMFITSAIFDGAIISKQSYVCNNLKTPYCCLLTLLQSESLLCVYQSIRGSISLCTTDLLSTHPILWHPVWMKGTRSMRQETALYWPNEEIYYCHMTELPASLVSVSSVLFTVPWSPPTDSVGEVAHLMQFEQKAVHDVKCGEANSHSNRPFKPVHAQAFVQSMYNSLLCYDLTHCPQNCAVWWAGNAGCLHAPPYHIQRVRGRLSNQACAGTKSQALIGVRLGPLSFFCVQLLQGLICEKCDPCIWDDTQDSGGEASVKRLHTFLLGDPHEDVHDVAVPVWRKSVIINQYMWYVWHLVIDVNCSGPFHCNGKTIIGFTHTRMSLFTERDS